MTLRNSKSNGATTCPLQIAVVGTRGVPARYGGFETLAEQLANNVDPDATRLTLYGQRSAYSSAERRGGFKGHPRVWMPFSAGGAQSLIHDALQLFHAAFIKRHSHILLLGTSAAWLLPFVRLFRRNLRIVTNVDGLEWRRDKFGALARNLLKTLETFAVRSSNIVIADNDALVPMVREIHGIEPVMIAYGADQVQVLGDSGSDPRGYLLAIARVEPENNTAMILSAVRAAGAKIVFVGNWQTSDYGRSLIEKYQNASGIDLRSPVYDQAILADIRSGSSAYVHGHSVGGTNPSLVEAIYHSSRILAFDCSFNRATLDNAGEYFSNDEELAKLIRRPDSGLIAPEVLALLRGRYRWDTIVRQYIDVLTTA